MTSTTALRADIVAALEFIDRPASISEVATVLERGGTEATKRAVSYAIGRLHSDGEVHRQLIGNRTLISLTPIDPEAAAEDTLDDQLCDVVFLASERAMSEAGVDAAWLAKHRPRVIDHIGDAVESAVLTWCNHNGPTVAAAVAARTSRAK